jgi:ABC-type lipoprotein release transport system permease subunit
LILGQIPVDLAALVPPAGTTPGLGAVTETAAYTLPARLSWELAVLAMVTAVVGGGLVAFLTARRAARLKPAEALRNSR